MAPNLAGTLQLFRSVDRLLVLESRHRDTIRELARNYQVLANRVANLEAREGILVAEAKAAAATAASAAATAHVADMARQIGVLEERTRRLGQDPSPTDRIGPV